ncbi:hypothetical protein E2320_008068, partial [Naja naja]
RAYGCNGVILSLGLLPVPSTSGTQFAETSVRERMREKLKAVRIGDHLLSAVQRKEGKVSARVKFRDVVRRGKQKSQIQMDYPSSEEAYNFFTFNFGSEEETVGGDSEKSEKNASDLDDKGRENQKSTLSNQEEQEENKMDEEEHLFHDKGNDGIFIIEQTRQDFLEIRPAEYESYSGRVQKEKDTLFIPSMLRGIPSVEQLRETFLHLDVRRAEPVQRMEPLAENTFNGSLEKLSFFLNQVWVHLGLYAPAYPVTANLKREMDWVMGLHDEEVPDLEYIDDFLAEFRARFKDETQIWKAESEIWALRQGS